MVALKTKSKNAAIDFAPSRFVTGAGSLTIHAARCSAEYLVIPITTDFAGRAFVLAKIVGCKGSDKDAGSYDVFLANAGSREHDSCNCKGHSYRPNQPHGCKHLAAMKAVLAAGGMAVPQVEESVESMLARIEAVAARQFAEPSATTKPIAKKEPAHIAAYRAANGGKLAHRNDTADQTTF